MFTGIDLAADPRRTGVATLRDEGAAIVVSDVHVGADDDDVIAHVAASTKAGVDVPFGWPRAFTQLIMAHRAGTLEPPADTGPDWRREVLFRATDREVRRRVGKVPLSVASDKIAYPAIRWAGIAARLRADGTPTPLDGSGRACEVYPGGALAVWGLPHAKYKGTQAAEVRRRLVERLAERLPSLDWGGHRDSCIADDNALDAVIAALIARAVARGEAVPPPPELSEEAAAEGWIWLPAS